MSQPRKSSTNLAPVFSLARRSHARQIQRPAPSWIIDRLKEIAAIDPGSTAFRYGENYDRTLKADVAPVASAMYVSLPHLQRAMLTLNAALRGEIAEVARDHPIRYFEERDFGDEDASEAC